MYIETPSTNTIIEKIKANNPNSTILLFIAETDMLDIPELIQKLNEANIKFLGGVFPKLIYDNEVKDRGVVINFIKKEIGLFKVQNIEEKNYEIPTLNLSREKSYCTFTLVDGLTGNISHYLSELYRNFGNYCSYLGGGSGSLTLKQQPCVFDRDGFYMDAAVVIVFETKVSIGVKHGWQRIEGPIIATKTDKNVIKELNWRKAFDIYKEAVEQDAKTEIREDNFFDIAKAYPFGMVKENSESIVRDPIATNEKGELICVGEVMENTVVDILKGVDKNLIASATEAANIALKNVKEVNNVLIVDCISRVLFLEDKFEEELNNVSSAIKKDFSDAEISGALTLGEISSYNGYLEFLNKTLVVGLFS